MPHSAELLDSALAGAAPPDGAEAVAHSVFMQFCHSMENTFVLGDTYMPRRVLEMNVSG